MKGVADDSTRLGGSLALPAVIGLVVAGCNSPALVEMRGAAGSSMRVATSARLGGKGGTMLAGNGWRFLHYDNNEESFNRAAAWWGWSRIASAAADAVDSVAENATKVEIENAQVEVLGIKAGVEQAKINAAAEAGGCHCLPSTQPLTIVARLGTSALRVHLRAL